MWNFLDRYEGLIAEISFWFYIVLLVLCGIALVIHLMVVPIIEILSH